MQYIHKIMFQKWLWFNLIALVYTTCTLTSWTSGIHYIRFANKQNVSTCLLLRLVLVKLLNTCYSLVCLLFLKP